MNYGSENNKNPYISATLNFFLWGSGYIYSGTKKIYGYGLILFEILMHIPWFYIGLANIFTVPHIFETISMLLLSIVLAFDGYSEIKKLRTIS